MSTKVSTKDELDDLLDRIASSKPEEKVYEVVTQFAQSKTKQRLSEVNEKRMVDANGKEIIYVILKEKKKKKAK